MEIELFWLKKELISSIDAKDWDTIIETSGGHIYPGFVNTNNIHWV